MRNFVYTLGLCWMFGASVWAQDTLLLEDALQVALEQNYGILIAYHAQEVQENNAHPGAAGLLPSVALSGGYNYSNSDVEVDFASPAIESVDASGVTNKSTQAGINVNYTLFNGMGRVRTLEVLRTTADLSQVQTRAVIESTISQVASAYYLVARLADSYRTLEESLAISRDRIERARNQQAFGSTNKLAVLNAEVDFNTDSANLATTYFSLENGKRSLNALIGRAVETPFEVSQQVQFDPAISLESLMAEAEANNSALALATYNQQISELNLQVTKAQYAPTIGATAGYNFNLAENGPGNILQRQQSLGLSLGATLTYNLFSGNQRKVAVQNATLAVQQSRYAMEEAQLNLERDLSNAYYTYQSSIQQWQLEQKSLESAQQNFERTMNSFELGQATNVQFREAQLNLQRVKDRLSDLRYSAKLNEIELLRLSGALAN